MRRNESLPTVQDAFNAAKRSTQSHYRAATPSRGAPRPSAVPSYGVDADHWLVDESKYWYLVELARYFADNDPIYGPALQRIADNVIGCGYKVDPTTGVDELDDYLARDWGQYSTDPDASDTAGEHDLHRRAHMEFVSMVSDGDVFGIPRSDGTIQTLESHRCKTSRGTKRDVLLGIEHDKDGKRTRYWFTRNDVGTSYSPKMDEIEQVVARDSLGNRRVWHYYLPKRVSQRRGVSALAPIAEFVQMHSDIQYGKLFQQQAASAIAFFHELPIEAFQQMSQEERDLAVQVLAEAAETPTKTLKAGLDLWSRFPGEKLTGFSPAVPNPEYFAHVTLILTVIAVNLGLPVQVLLLDPKQTNFSGWRGAMDLARRGFERLQKDHGMRWYRDRYKYRIRYLLANRSEFGELVERSGFDVSEVVRDRSSLLYSASISPPKWRYIQPVDDIRARVNEVGNHLVSPSQDANSWGCDYWETVDQTVADNAYGVRRAKEEAAKLNSEFASDEDRVSWRELWAPIRPESERFNISRQLDATEVEEGPIDDVD